MKKLWGYFRSYAQDFPWMLHLVWLAVLAVAIYFNYRYDFENTELNTVLGSWKAYRGFFLLYGGGYFITVLLMALFRQPVDFIRSKWFWIKSIFFLGVLTGNAASSFHYDWIWTADWVQPEFRYFAYKVGVNLGSVVIMFTPLVIFWLVIDRGNVNGLYGLARKGFIPAPYFILLAAMIPLILWASFQSDFLYTYPTYRSNGTSEAFLNLPMWLTTAFYEIAYGVDFIGVELLFRGALVIGMARVMGKQAILPMVTVYCFLHFGKPMGECISSIFGGYILGVIAYYGKNIWGGALVHIGIALMMEWAALLQRV